MLNKLRQAAARDERETLDRLQQIERAWASLMPTAPMPSAERRKLFQAAVDIEWLLEYVADLRAALTDLETNYVTDP